MEIITKSHCFFECVVFFLVMILCQTCHSKGSDTIYSGQSLCGNQTLSSKGEVFELGFFTPGNSLNYYLGIWYKKPGNKTVVWVANRNQPVSDPFISSFKLLKNGSFTILSESQNSTIWSSKPVSKVSNSTIGVLLDSGNFVIRDESDSSAVIWQSFDHPTDTWLPRWKIGYNKLTNERLILSPWKNPQDPAPGIFSLEVEPNGTSHLLLWNDSIVYWTSGNWTGKYFSLVTEIQLDQYATNITYVSNENESYFTYDATFTDALTRFMIDTTGQLKQYVWGKDFGRWNLYWMKPTSQCEVYAFCGPFSKCNQQDLPLCVCLEGFVPKVRKDWELEDHSGGCVRKTPLRCNGGQGNDAFVTLSDVTMPSALEAVVAESKENCRLACLSNCSCTAYAYDGQCSLWKGDLLNQRLLLPHELRKSLYLRISASDLKETNGLKKNMYWIIVAILAGLCCLLVIASVFVRKRYFVSSTYIVKDSLEVFRYRDLKGATKNFSKKLGEGGFGSVYKGTLQSDSTEVAVKVLKSVKQGEKQFRAEVMTIGMIQHVNLVRLRGFCADSSKRLLVYDYMPMGSIESLLFQKLPTVLAWEARYRIAVGTAKGLCYLHEECRDRIIHCDIKPENILLDSDLHPKLADFGLAKLVGRDFSRVLTTMRGTRGYLAPEWLSGQAITPKADVFSYGMLLFELISGRRNSEMSEDGMDDYFPHQVAKSLKGGEETVVNLLDPRLEGNGNKDEIIKASKIACWCIQDDEKQRPSMSLVVQVLMGIVEVDVPPIPLFIQRLAGTGQCVEFTNYEQEKTTCDSALSAEETGTTTQYFSAK